jgi:hypothetical protein
MAAFLALASAADAQDKPKKLAIDRTGIDLKGRPMYLRPYHPPYVVSYYGLMREGKLASPGSIVKWKPLLDRVENEPNLRVMMIQGYDDACAGCAALVPDPSGHPWGVGYTCHADAAKVREVTRYSQRILGELGLYYGSEVSMKQMVALLDENVKVLYEGIGGPGNQEMYEKGLVYLKEKYKI